MDVSGCDQAQRDRNRDSFGARAAIHPFLRAFDVLANGGHSETEFDGNGRVVPAARDERQAVEFAGCQAVGICMRSSAVHAPQALLGQCEEPDQAVAVIVERNFDV